MSKTITATTKATKAMLAASSALMKQSAELFEFTTTAAAVAFDIEVKQSELAAVEDDLAIKVRKSAAELALAILENKEKQLVTLMKDAQLATISVLDLKTLNEQVTTLQDTMAQGIKDAVDAALSIAESQSELAKQQVAAVHSVANATKEASITSSENQVAMLTAQIESLNETITAERKARVDIAASESNRPTAALAPVSSRAS
jgi:hypothetical protein